MQIELTVGICCSVLLRTIHSSPTPSYDALELLIGLFASCADVGYYGAHMNQTTAGMYVTIAACLPYTRSTALD